VVAPTGSGKTILGTAIVQAAVERGKNVLWLAHRRELIYQCSSKLDVEHGIVMAGEPTGEHPVQVASVQTLARREVPCWDLLIIDEAHHATSATYQKAINSNPKGVVLGLTATPVRYDGKGLGGLFSYLHEVATISELVGDGYLVAPRVFAPYVPDLSEARLVRGDFDRRAVDRVMGQPQVVGNILETWLEKAAGERTILFAPSVKQSKELVEEFRSKGVAAAHLDGETKKETRDTMLQEFAAGRITVLSNYGVITEGYDCPAASCCLLARPTNSVSLFLQMCGRITRPFDGKEALVLDHAGNTLRHGFPTESRAWELEPAKKPRDTRRGAALKTCPDCYAISPTARRTCILCGYEFWPVPRLVRTAAGELVEIDGVRARQLSSHRLQWVAERGAWLRAKIAEGARKGYKPGWARMQYKARHGFWPNKDVIDAARAPDPAGHSA